MLPQTYTVPVAPLSPALVRSLHARAGAARWQVPEAAFAEALARSLRHRYPDAPGAAPSRAPDEPDPSTVEHYLSDLHLADLALAQACAAGHDGAWRHFLDELRPALRRAAHAIAGEDGGDLADALYGDLFGLEERDGRRRSLFEYYHGRSSLIGWLRSVLSQRWVDRVRAARRTEPLPDDGDTTRAALLAPAPAPEAADAARYVPMLREVVRDAFAALAPRERLRLSLYYRQGLRLAAAGRLLGEHEATVSRQLERTRRRLREDVEERLTARGLDAAERARCFEVAVEDWGFDLGQVLPSSEAVTRDAPDRGPGWPPAASHEPPGASRQPVEAERKKHAHGRSERGGGAW